MSSDIDADEDAHRSLREQAMRSMLLKKRQSSNQDSRDRSQSPSLFPIESLHANGNAVSLTANLHSDEGIHLSNQTDGKGIPKHVDMLKESNVEDNRLGSNTADLQTVTVDKVSNLETNSFPMSIASSLLITHRDTLISTSEAATVVSDSAASVHAETILSPSSANGNSSNGGENEAAPGFLGYIDDFLTDQRKRVEAIFVPQASAKAVTAAESVAKLPIAGIRPKRGAAQAGNPAAAKRRVGGDASKVTDPKLVVTFGSDSDEETEARRRLLAQSATVGTVQTAGSVASKVAANGRVTVAVSGAGRGTSPAPTSASSKEVPSPSKIMTPKAILEKKIALLKQKIQQKQAAAAAGGAPAIHAPSGQSGTRSAKDPSTVRRVSPSLSESGTERLNSLTAAASSSDTSAAAQEALLLPLTRSVTPESRARSPAVVDGDGLVSRRRSPSSSPPPTMEADQGPCVTDPSADPEVEVGSADGQGRQVEGQVVSNNSESAILSLTATNDQQQSIAQTSSDSASANRELLATALGSLFSGSAVGSGALQNARDSAERRLRAIRRLMEENLREDLELQMQIHRVESTIAEQQRFVMEAQDLLNIELIRAAESGL